MLQLFISSPSYADAERRHIDGVISEVNAASGGRVLIVAIGRDMPASAGLAELGCGAADCDAVISIMRPRLPGDPPEPVGAAADMRGGASGLLSAVQGRRDKTGLPDLYIFRYAGPGAGNSAADWEQRKQAFIGWFRSKGGTFLTFEDFAQPEEFRAKFRDQLLLWLEREFPTPPAGKPEDGHATALANLPEARE